MISQIRCILFNILFYGVLTPLVCILLMPVLVSRKATLWVARKFHDWTYYLEKYVLGLDYEVRGKEFWPAKDETQFLIAAKHYSAYETLKLYRLFGDPTIIMKRELLKLPIFGWFLARLGVIAIDRGNRDQAANSLAEGAKRMKKDNRPILIFPQGTRVRVDATTAEKPYKGGILKLYRATNLPIVPLAMNSGVYWPRNSFWKKPGKVVFEFLPHIPAGLPEREVMAMLEKQIETKSAELVAEGKAALAEAEK